MPAIYQSSGGSSGAVWGSITGNVPDQIDLYDNYLLFAKTGTNNIYNRTGVHFITSGVLNFVIGDDNTNAGSYNFISGNGQNVSGSFNSVNGSTNFISGNYNLIGGDSNSITAQRGFTAGQLNSISAPWCAAMGYNNVISASYSTGFGLSNTNSGLYGLVAGYQNNNSANWSSALFGYQNVNQGYYSLTAGFQNTNQGYRSLLVADRCTLQSNDCSIISSVTTTISAGSTGCTVTSASNRVIPPGRNFVHCSDEFEALANGKGIVIQSPNTTRWRLTVDNAGALVIAAA